jgi:DNA-binding CsgD family transcriptional regulator
MVMGKVTIESLKTLFDYFDTQHNAVLWITSLDNQRQLYLSPHFEKIWGVKTNEMFERRGLWRDYLFEDDKDRIAQQVDNRQVAPETAINDHMLYRIRDTENRVHFMQGTPFLLTDQNDTHIAFAGLTQEISERQWLDEIDAIKSGRKNPLKQYVFDILRNELHIQTASIHNNIKSSKIIDSNLDFTIIYNGRPVEITTREAECLYHLASGKSAKQTAASLNISKRTVEFHLNNIKDKAGCRTKLELLTKISSKAQKS